MEFTLVRVASVNCRAVLIQNKVGEAAGGTTRATWEERGFKAWSNRVRGREKQRNK